MVYTEALLGFLVVRYFARIVVRFVEQGKISAWQCRVARGTRTASSRRGRGFCSLDTLVRVLEIQVEAILRIENAGKKRIAGKELDGAGCSGIEYGDCPDMKIRSLAWMGAGLFLAGVAGAAVVCRRKGERELPPEPGETREHAELRRIMEQSAAYNDTLYAKMQKLAEEVAPAVRSSIVAELTAQNKKGRMEIDQMRETLQTHLATQGRTFADVDGFAELISEYRGITLAQQKRHLELYQRVRKLENVPSTPELHAYLKLGFKETEQLHADTERQLMKAAAEQRELMLRAGRVLSSVVNADYALKATEELNALGDSYMQLSARIKLYKEDDAAGAVAAVAELRSLYAALLPMLQTHAKRLREAAFFDCDGLRDVVERMLPEKL